MKDMNKLMEECILLEALLMEVGLSDSEAANKKTELVETYEELHGYVWHGGKKIYSPIPEEYEYELLEKYKAWGEEKYKKLMELKK